VEPKVTVGVVVVVERAGRYLLIRRAAGVIAPGAWCFVGGAVEPGETQAEAAVREFREEVGGEVRPLRAVWKYVRPDGGLRLHFWEAELIGEVLQPNPAEVAEIGWYTAAEIEALPDGLASNVAFLRSRADGRK
jgi:8-oxo-dGTP pyrophosphatase MutT (NUDIX family)